MEDVAGGALDVVHDLANARPCRRLGRYEIELSLQSDAFAFKCLHLFTKQLIEPLRYCAGEDRTTACWPVYQLVCDVIGCVHSSSGRLLVAQMFFSVKNRPGRKEKRRSPPR
jgi:hypothetical protein